MIPTEDVSVCKKIFFFPRKLSFIMMKRPKEQNHMSALPMTELRNTSQHSLLCIITITMIIKNHDWGSCTQSNLLNPTITSQSRSVGASIHELTLDDDRSRQRAFSSIPRQCDVVIIKCPLWKDSHLPQKLRDISVTLAILHTSRQSSLSRNDRGVKWTSSALQYFD